jgi:hypothetical protein
MEKLAGNLTEEIDKYGGIQSPIDCGTLKMFTAYGVFMFGGSFIFNSLLLYAFYKNKALRIPINMFILAITVVNLLATITEASVILSSTYSCRQLLVYFILVFRK